MMEVDTQLKNTGVSLAYLKDEELVGYLQVTKAKLRWTDKHGKKPTREVSWDQLIEWMKS
ncbi:MAG: hypothetical protein R3C68_09925 [Myxococcota bacterium]